MDQKDLRQADVQALLCTDKWLLLLVRSVDGGSHD